MFNFYNTLKNSVEVLLTVTLTYSMSEADDWIPIQKDEAHCKRERERARELRRSSWWNQQLQKGVCHYCHNSFQPDELTMDHVLPVVRGGKSTHGNCVPSCKTCNNEKKYLTPAEWIMKQLENENQNKSS